MSGNNKDEFILIMLKSNRCEKKSLKEIKPKNKFLNLKMKIKLIIIIIPMQLIKPDQYQEYPYWDERCLLFVLGKTYLPYASK